MGIGVFTYHKSGTVLSERLMRRVAARQGLRFGVIYGRVEHPPAVLDIAVFAHSQIGFDPAFRGMRAIRVVRDPRDIWLSGYLYHRHCDEGWCVNTDFSDQAPVSYPRVDFSMLHRRERWKRDYLKSLGGRSYRQNLRERDLADGLAFELAGYTAGTLAAMQAWKFAASPAVLQVKLEDFSTDFDGTVRRMLRHLGLDEASVAALVTECADDDVNRMSDAALLRDPHIHSRQLSKWPDMLPRAQLRDFERRYGGLIRDLGYRLSTDIGDGQTAVAAE